MRTTYNDKMLLAAASPQRCALLLAVAVATVEVLLMQSVPDAEYSLMQRSEIDPFGVVAPGRREKLRSL